MLKLYSATSSLFKRHNPERQRTYRNVTATTGLLSHSHTKTASFDNTRACGSKAQFSNTSRNTYNSHELSGSATNTKQLSFCVSHKKTNSSCTASSNYEMKKLKMKVHKFINLKKSQLCRRFEHNHNEVNHNLNACFQSESHIKQYISSHHNCYFNKNKIKRHTYACNTASDCLKRDKETKKHFAKQIKDEFKHTFTEQEKQAIVLDPAYYIPNKKANIHVDAVKRNKLSDRINTEDRYAAQQLKETMSKSYKQRKRFITLEYKQILNEIVQLKEHQLNDANNDHKCNRAHSRNTALPRAERNTSQQHRRNKSVTDRKGKNVHVHVETDRVIDKAVNKARSDRLSYDLKTCRERGAIEKELANCYSKVMNLRKRKYPVIPVVKEDNLTEVCKREYRLMLNKEQLSKIAKFIEKEKKEEKAKDRRQKENKVINYYVTKVKEQYLKSLSNNNNNNHVYK